MTLKTITTARKLKLLANHNTRNTPGGTKALTLARGKQTSASSGSSASSKSPSPGALDLGKQLALSFTTAALVLGASGAVNVAPVQAKPAPPVERKKGKVVIKQPTAKVKNFAEEGPVSIPTLPSLPGSNYSKSASASSSSGGEKTTSSGPSFSLPSFSLPSFSAPSVNIDIPNIPNIPNLPGASPGASTQAIAVLGAEIVAFGAASAAVGGLTKE